MPELLRTIVLATLGIMLAIVVIMAGTSERAVAPTDDVPVRIDVESVALPKTTTSTLPASIPEISSEPEKETQKTEAGTQESAKDLEQKLNETLVSLAQTLTELNAEKAASASLSSPRSTNERVRAALVNILCTTEAAGPFSSISASGVVVDPRGVILTNAHVGQFFLLKNYPRQNFVSCIIRTGSPAQAMYTAELLFLPPSWIAANAQKINDEVPTGNGERDYALLRITGGVSSAVVLPSSFNYLPVAVYAPQQGAEVIVAGYPAGFLGGITIQKELYSASSVARIGEIFTYEANTADLFSIGGSVVAQQGSSGGAVANNDSVLVGLITTSTTVGDTSSRDLRAISTEYIIRDFAKESGVALANFLGADLALQASLFAKNIAPTLTQELINAIENK